MRVIVPDVEGRETEFVRGASGQRRAAVRVPSGWVVDLDEKEVVALENGGTRVVRLPDADVFRVGDAEITVATGRLRRKPKLRVPAALVDAWPHHVLHLVAPLETAWAGELAALGLQVLETVGRQGVAVRGAPAAVARTATLPWVDWRGAMEPEWKLAADLRERRGLVEDVHVLVDGVASVDAIADVIRAAGGRVIYAEPASEGGAWYGIVRAAVDARVLPQLAERPDVWRVEFAGAFGLDGERESLIVAEVLNAANTQPVVGYQAWLTTLGFDGTGSTVAICDTGVDRNSTNNTNGHTDLLGRQAAFVSYTGAPATDTDGHGTHVAGIAIGSGASGQVEAGAPNNFLWGLGVAPGAQYVTQNRGLATTTPTDATITRDAVQNGATTQNNSWFNGAEGSGYTVSCANFDRAVRDADTTAAGMQPLAVVFSAGNNGGFPTTLTAPHEAKNIIVVGNSLTSRPGVGFPDDTIAGISATSSRGPTVDGRIGPTVVAPGTNVSSIWSFNGNTGFYGAPIAGTGTPGPGGTTVDQYQYMSGTSQAAPHVTGATAVIGEWWRDRTGGKAPSPALLKALLVNSAEDLAGGPNWRCTNRRATDKAAWSLNAGSIYQRTLGGFVPAQVVEGNTNLTQVAALANITAAGQWFYNAATNTLFVRMLGNTNPGAANVPFIVFRDATPLANVPNNDQGWGRVSLENLFFQAPASDRGPRLFLDQTTAFTTNGDQHVWNVSAVDPTRPLRVTLAWTDPPGSTVAPTALVNNLNLEVQLVGSASVFRGNSNFVGGFSNAGGAADTLNNLECVYVQAPGAGVYQIRVVAASLTTDARPPHGAVPWQDFALVVENAAFAAANPVNVVTLLDRSGSMVSLGYVDTTRAVARQFIDLMSVGDGLGVASFGTAGSVDYQNSGSVKVIASVTDQADARAAVNGLVFDGCTYMGDGIAKAGGLLSGVTGSRAIVLLSDGYDNRGCAPDDLSRPDAATAAAALPGGSAIYACAMGPLSDQALLQSLASSTNGRYYYMPTIDDLREIYNYVRGNVTGTSISANESATASSSRVPAWVDGLSEEATFVVAWGPPGLRAVSRDPRKSNEISVRLRSPSGRLVPANASWVRRVDGDGYVIFRVEAPRAGRWYMEVATERQEHTRYQAACFLRSGLTFALEAPDLVQRGAKLPIRATLLANGRVLPGARAVATVSRPIVSVPDLIAQLGDRLARVKAVKDGPPGDLGRLARLVTKDEDAAKLLRHSADRLGMVYDNDIGRTGRGPLVGHAGSLSATRSIAATIGSLADITVRRDLLTREALGAFLRPSGAYVATVPTPVAGSYNLVVEVAGLDPISGTRYARKEMVSARVV